jgi:hypothetical protein
MYKSSIVVIVVGLLTVACGGVTEPTVRVIAERAVLTGIASWPTPQSTTTPAPTSTPAPTATPQIAGAPFSEIQRIEALRQVLPATPTPITLDWIESMVLTALPPSPTPMKPTPNATPVTAGTYSPSGSTPLELLSAETRKTSESSTRWLFGWTATVRNNTSAAEDFFLYTYLTDADGFAIEYDITGMVMIGAGQTLTVAGIIDVDLPQARNVTKATARIAN